MKCVTGNGNDGSTIEELANIGRPSPTQPQNSNVLTASKKFEHITTNITTSPPLQNSSVITTDMTTSPPPQNSNVLTGSIY